MPFVMLSHTAKLLFNQLGTGLGQGLEVFHTEGSLILWIMPASSFLGLICQRRYMSFAIQLRGNNSNSYDRSALTNADDHSHGQTAQKIRGRQVPGRESSTLPPNQRGVYAMYENNNKRGGYAWSQGT